MPDFSTTKFRRSLKEQTRDRKVVYLSLLGLVLYIVVGGMIYSEWLEPMSFIDGMYFAVVTFTTVGYGDINPTSEGSKAFTIVFVLIGVAITSSILLTVISDYCFNWMKNVLQSKKKAKSKLEQKIMKQASMRNFKIEDETNEEKENSISDGVCRVLLKNNHWFLVIIIPAIIIGVVERWTPLEIIYFAVITSTTGRSKNKCI